MNTTEVLNCLARRLDSGTAHSRGPLYDRALNIWNGAVKHRPAVVVHCVTAGDVQQAVLVARTHGIPLSVRGGGHDWAGRSLRDGGLVIDLSGMREVTVSLRGAKAVTVAGGATAADVTAVTGGHGLTTATGNMSGIGMAGLALGGGYGPLSGRIGLAADNLLSAQVVLADGSIVNADPGSEPDLYWALRGGGGNFGVVTAMRFRLHTIQRFLAGLIIFPWSAAAGILSRLDEVLGASPDELTVQPAILPWPDGSSVLSLAPTWSGDLAAGQKHLERLQALSTPVMANLGPVTHAELLSQFDTHVVDGRHVVLPTRNIPLLSGGVADVLVNAGDTRSSPLTAITMHHMHGAAARVPVQDTAFGTRAEHFMVEIVTSWENDDGDRHRAWADQVSADLEPYAIPGGYPNLLGPDAHEQIAHAYGPNAARLRVVKAAYDPDRVFEAIPLPLHE